MVDVSVQDPDSGLYWDWDLNAPGFTSEDPVFAQATDTSGSGTWATWTISFTAPAGSYSVVAKVTDLAGNSDTITEAVTV